MKTRVTFDEWKGNKLFAIRESSGDPEVDKVDREKPLFSFGLKKASYLYKHLDEFKKFCEENGLVE